ncbi:MAG TPA: carboxypeptidase-like regulatory domain-containing protein [Candidatus Aquilonibacter sp.]|nr:carboxypeptidase-like regulatory domain-containing protein [Candidatus Aquilonibacter sp.]
MNKRGRAIPLGLLFMLTLAAQGTAGTTGVLNGYVRDDAGRPEPDVRVSLQSRSGIAQAVTDERGFFAFIDLAPDRYTLYAHQLHGYRAAYSESVRVASDQTTFVSFRIGNLPRCGPRFIPSTIAMDQRSEPFISLDVRAMESQPPLATIPIALPPITYDYPPGRCL